MKIFGVVADDLAKLRWGDLVNIGKPTEKGRQRLNGRRPHPV